MAQTDISTSMQSDVQSWTLALGRLLLAPLFILAGVGKIADISGTAGYIASVGLPLPTVGVIVAIAVEFLGGLALLAGFKTRPVALILGAFTVVTAIFFHHDFADQMQMVMFLKNLAITGGLLFVAVFGPGKISVDRR